MKTINLVAVLAFTCYVGQAQETLQSVTDRGNTTTNSLQIGGSSLPISKLDVRGIVVSSNYGIITPLVNIMTTDAPTIGVGAAIALGGKTGNASANYAFSYLIGAKETTAYNNYAGYFAIHTVSGGENGEANSANYERFRIASNGNVSIGTSDAKGYKLAVAGNMVAESVLVKLRGAWPDYVFAKDYALPSLKETEKHIHENGHLPGIPSAGEVKANGIDLGEMNAILVKKIEELTLHLIEQQKQIEDLQKDRKSKRLN